MMRRTSLGGYHWSPFLYVLREMFQHEDRVSMGNYGDPLMVIKNQEALEIKTTNVGFLVAPVESGVDLIIRGLQDDDVLDEQGLFRITQDERGIDVVDRIDEGIKLIHHILNAKA